MRCSLTGFIASIALVLLTVPARAQAPSAPRDLTATVSGTQITLHWLDPDGLELDFKVERKTGSNGTYAQIGTTGTANYPRYTDSTGLVGNIYYYRVRGTNGSGCGRAPS